MLDMLQNSSLIVVIVSAVVFVGLVAMIVNWYKKAKQGEAIVKTGMGGTKVSFSGLIVVPVIHKHEMMDITLKTILTQRMGKDGLICKDNLRADIKVAFFVRVNQTAEDVKQVAQSIGCSRASDQKMVENLFDAKFSEALKTVGKKFDFEELYNGREDFKMEILQIIGTDLNGYILDDCAIDYLEQTPLTHLDENNILDSIGIKKIIEITSVQKVAANQIEKDKEMTLKKQNVEAEETILELDKQLTEQKEKQRREVESIKYREQAEIDKIKEEEHQKSEKARITAAEEIEILNENKLRQVILAEKQKEKTLAVENERVRKESELEAVERTRIVEIATIEKEKAVEEHKKEIQDVIRERVAVEKAVVIEEEKIKDTQEFAAAERTKSVALTKAEQEAQEALVKQIKAAEAGKAAAEHTAKQKLIEAEADQEASIKQAEAIKIMAEARAEETASQGMGEAKVIEAKAQAMGTKGEIDANITEMQAKAEAAGIKEKGIADAEVISIKADAEEKRGLAFVTIDKEKYLAEADGIKQKAEAMKALDGVGKEHEEFKLTLEKDKEIELAEINIQKDIAESQAKVLAEGLKSANIDIVGGESMFFEQITGAITKGKSVDRMMNNSESLTMVRDAFFDTSNGSDFKTNLRNFIDKFGMNSEDIKNLSVSNFLAQVASDTNGGHDQSAISKLLSTVNVLGIADKTIGSLGLL